MRLQAIEFEGFRGARRRVRLEIPSGFLVIVGRNGSGKSTVCDAIEFALTGVVRNSGDHKEKGEGIADYVWWRGKGVPESRYVALDLIDNDGQTVTVRRTPNGLEGVSLDEIVKIVCGKSTTVSDPLQQLAQIMMLRDETITKLSVDLKETERFDLVRAALGTDELVRYERRAKELHGVLKKAYSNADDNYKNMRQRVGDLTARLSELRSNSPASDAVRLASEFLRLASESDLTSEAELIKEGEKCLADAMLAIEQLGQLQSQLIEVQEAHLARATADTESPEDRADSLKDARMPMETELARMDVELRQISEDSPTTIALAQLHEHGSQLGLQDGSCPLCRTDQSEVHYRQSLEVLRKELDKRNVSAAELMASKREISSRIAKVKSEEAGLSTVLEARKQSRQRAERAWLNAKEIADKHSLEIGSPEEVQADAILKRLTELRTHSSDLAKHLATLGASVSRNQIGALEDEITGAKKELVAAERTLQKAEQSQSSAKAAYDVIRRMKGELIDERLAELQPLLLDLYQRLRPHIDWQEMRCMLRGDVQKMLRFEIGDGINPGFVFSSGQRRAAGLGFLLSLHLSAEWFRLKTLILDDPVQHIDDYRALHLIEVLSAVRKTGRQVVCAVEDIALAQLLARRLRSTDSSTGAIASMAYSSSSGVTVVSAERVRPFESGLLVS